MTKPHHDYNTLLPIEVMAETDNIYFIYFLHILVRSKAYIYLPFSSAHTRGSIRLRLCVVNILIKTVEANSEESQMAQ